MFDDDDYERGAFPPTKYPGREALTMALAALMVCLLIGYAIWKLIGWLWNL